MPEKQLLLFPDYDPRVVEGLTKLRIGISVAQYPKLEGFCGTDFYIEDEARPGYRYYPSAITLQMDADSKAPSIMVLINGMDSDGGYGERWVQLSSERSGLLPLKILEWNNDLGR